MSEALNNLLQTSGIWRASSIDHGVRLGIPSDYPELDRQLPGGGWPRDGVTELLHDQQGMGELRLIAPALARLSREQTRWITWVCPPYIPYAPALAAWDVDLSSLLVVTPGNGKDALWAIEKALLSHSCSAVLAWPGTIRNGEIRRLQVAAREGNCWSILFRPTQAAKQTSPAELRIRLEPSPVPSDNSSIEVCILKRRGGWGSDPFSVSLNDNLSRITPSFPELIVPGAERHLQDAEKSEETHSRPDNERFDNSAADERRFISVNRRLASNPMDGDWNGNIELQ
jgi:hypothetical protein|tara:strand:+ start:575 stop:1429 length:855 start_codon:yes stop_codon:yes gene_type:complete